MDALRSRALAVDPQFMNTNMRCSNRQAMVAAIEAITMREPIEYQPGIIRLGSNVDLEAHPALARRADARLSPIKLR